MVEVEKRRGRGTMNEAVKKIHFALGGFLIGALIFWIAGLVAAEQRAIEYQTALATSEERGRNLTSTIVAVQKESERSAKLAADLGSELTSTRAEVVELRSQIPRLSGKLSDADESLGRAEAGATGLQGLIDESLRKLTAAIESSEK